jgi:hypothetical protein
MLLRKVVAYDYVSENFEEETWSLPRNAMLNASRSTQEDRTLKPNHTLVSNVV